MSPRQLVVALFNRSRGAYFFGGLVVAVVGYFAGARLLQDYLYRGFRRPPTLFASFGPGFLHPEPYEIPLYLAGYLAIPILAFVGKWVLERCVAAVPRSARRWVVVAGAVLVVFTLARVAPVGKLAGFFSTALGYVQARGFSRALWLLTTKRLFVSVALVGGAALVFAAAYAFSRRPLPVRVPPFVDRAFARGWWLLLPLLALLVWHPNFPVDYHHYNYFLSPVNDQLHGKALLYETSSLYGVLNHYAISAVFRWVLPFTYPAFSLLLAIVFFGFLAGLFAMLRRSLTSSALAAVTTLAVFALLLLFQTSPTRSAYLFPAMTPFRFWLVVPAWWCVQSFARHSRWASARSALAWAALALFWNLDTGLAVGGAVLISLAASSSAPLLSRVRRLGGTYLAFAAAVFGMITLANIVIVGAPPDWLHYLRELRQVTQGYFVSPLPMFGLFQVLVFTYLAVLIAQARRLLSGMPLDGPLLFIAVYGALSMVYYIGESTWQQLYFVAWPWVVVIAVLVDRYLPQLAGSSRRLAAAGTYAVAAFFLGLILVKLPVEFGNRDYAAAAASFRRIPANEEVLSRDAEIIAREFAGSRVALVHINDSKLLYYAGKVNALPVYYSFNLYTPADLRVLADVLIRQQPEAVLVGNGRDAFDEFQRQRANELNLFRTMLPSAYVLSEQLETLDIYRLVPVPSVE
ncbi:MAG: hypothetical protein G01um101431_794 [Parcubacteria group bacterium Gr01-1014_31]|nr:MAG: hypothetical protein G01um101431_794 [Parcubacteria group bacterium Gr01-1014_31]